MKQVIIPIALLITISCTVQKHQTKNNSTEKEITVHTEQEKDSIQEQTEIQHIQYLSQDQLEITEIIPLGTFNYHTDSGYTGEATRIKIYRKTQKSQQEKDSTQITITHTKNKAKIDSTAHQQQHIQEETTKQTKPPTIWPYVIGVTILLIAAFILRKWVR